MTATATGDVSGVSFAGVAAISAGFGQAAADMADLTGDQRKQRLMRELQQVPLNPPLLVPSGSSSGTLQMADLLSPKAGFYWSLRRLAGWGFTAGTITVYKNAPGGEVLFVFPAAGTYTFGRGELILEPNSQLVFAATGVTVTAGAPGAQVGGAADCFPTHLLPGYLM
jgi:hypothetical protein